MTARATRRVCSPPQAPPRWSSHRICRPRRCTSMLSWRDSSTRSTQVQPPTSAKAARYSTAPRRSASSARAASCTPLSSGCASMEPSAARSSAAGGRAWSSPAMVRQHSRRRHRICASTLGPCSSCEVASSRPSQPWRHCSSRTASFSSRSSAEGCSSAGARSSAPPHWRTSPRAETEASQNSRRNQMAESSDTRFPVEEAARNSSSTPRTQYSVACANGSRARFATAPATVSLG
mmetsp:Transcript_20635/g.64984  ORF Transcript_20635/g.64984 Transcript_20635/m.64984 type:complete len:235 (-) Transcript_20635:104-808(-)